MARTALTVQHISRSGITPSFAAANADGNYFENNGETFLEIKNAGSEITVTIQVERKMDGLTVPDRTVVVAASTGDKMIGPFPIDYNQPGTTQVYVDYTAVTTVTVGAFDLG